ncbi:MAG TPA: HAD-IA family hydrolase [Candidatus Dojkabacteria bacterium]|nr:HAD-IA family hydrolase [Candidatus Dojkabacteria bacterium]
MAKKVAFDFYNVLYDKESGEVSQDVLNVVKDLSKNGFEVYLFTNSSIDFLKKNDLKIPFIKYFRKIISCNEYRKPSKEAFEKLVNEIKCEYGDIIMIDDSERNVKEGQKLGIIGVQYTDVGSLRKFFGV